MYIKKSLAVVIALVVLAVGYVAGTFIGLPNVDNTMLKGDISKAEAFNKKYNDLASVTKRDSIGYDEDWMNSYDEN